MLTGHHTDGYFLQCVAFSPDGKTLASGSSGGPIFLWDVTTGTLKNTLIGHAGWVNSVAFSPDGNTLASGSFDNTIRLWDIATGTLKDTLGHTTSWASVEFSPNGKTLASHVSGTVFLWDIVPAEPPRLAADVNGDGQVNIQDLVAVAAAFGEAAAGAPSASHLSAETVQQWLSDAKQRNLTDATSQRGIRFLEQFLLALTPKETTLLPNYPNPFNPETWIPYQLAKPVDVTLHIHTVDGSLVRVLSLGHKATGIYQTRSRAAYWDGRNEVGEPVASGVYFYTLTAGDFTATRKMLIRK